MSPQREMITITTFTCSRNQLAFALASCLDSAGEEYNNDFGILADAVALLLTRHDTTRDRGPNPRTEAEMRAREVRKRGLSDAVLAAAHEAGEALGRSNVDYMGRQAGVRCAPAPSRAGKLLALAEQTRTEVKQVG